MRSLNLAGKPFPNNEHLIPINSFASEEGITLFHSGLDNNNNSKSNQKTGIIRGNNNENKYSQIKYQNRLIIN